MLNNLFAYLTVAFMDIKAREEGQGLVEYALILVLISVAAIVTMGALGIRVSQIFTQIQGALTP